MAAGGGSVGRARSLFSMASILLKPGDVAKKLCLSTSTVLRMLRCGELLGVCVREGKRKRTYRVYEQAFEKWLKRRTVVPATRSSQKPSSGAHTNGRDNCTHVLPQDGQRMGVTEKPSWVNEKSSGDLDAPSGFQGANDGR